MSDWKEEIDKFAYREPAKVKDEFLAFLKEKYNDYLDGKISDKDISNMTVYWFSTKENFSDSLIEQDRRIKELRAGMDITHPDLSKDRKNKIVEELIERINEIVD